MTERYFVYKCIADDGKAPCVDRNLLTLTICKPKIRESATVDDWIFAFGSNSESPANRLIYIAKISKRLTGAEYFDLSKYEGRQDCIYERTADGVIRRRSDATVHESAEAQRRDIGSHPTYENAIALVCADFRYFGASGSDAWIKNSPRLKVLVENLGQGHRVNHSQEIRDELRKLKDFIWQRFPKKVNGTPLHADNQKSNCGLSAKACEISDQMPKLKSKRIC
jgi:hypothetical protein